MNAARAAALPLAFLLAQAALMAAPAAVARPAAYVVMVAAPLLAAAAAAWRARAEAPSARAGWFAVAASLTVWSIGAFANLWHEWVLGRQNEMYRAAMLAFDLAAVPIAYLLATDWRTRGLALLHAIDAALALALGYAFFIATWALLTARGTPDEQGVAAMVALLDAQNAVLALGAIARWRAAVADDERALFRRLAAYQWLYTVLIFVNNRFIAGDPAIGPQWSTVITLAFALLAGLALKQAPAGAAGARKPSARLVRVVHAASPVFLPAGLLLVSLFVIRVDYALGAAGVVLAVLGYGARTTLTQVRHMERGETLQAIALTDALTGVANRRFLDEALADAVRAAHRSARPLAVLMIDIDHFKALNDRYGHPRGDAVLREVAAALRDALVRPSDVLARYGGEEFIALLPDADAAAAALVAERLRAAVQRLGLEHLDSPQGVVTVSVGTAASGLRRTPPAAAALVAAADKALYEAKCAGRNRVAGAPPFA